jgi:hypothetical protein
LSALDIDYRPGVYGLAGSIGVEFTLNLVWLSLAGLCLLRWGTLALLFPDQRRITAAIALVCVIVFLFPVISATDDLAGAPAVCETSKLKKWVSAELEDALLCSTMIPLLPRPAAHGPVTPDLALQWRAPEIVWSGLERRPPPVIS